MLYHSNYASNEHKSMSPLAQLAQSTV